MLTLSLILLLAYLVGSIPTSILFGRLVRGIDIREFGSGNAGATNVYRVLGLRAALIVFLIDAGKAAAVLLLLTTLRIDHPPLDGPLLQIAAGLSVITGNMWPVFAGFSGGKGVSTIAGIFIALVPIAAACAILVWIGVTAMTKYVSLGSIIASLTLPAVTLVLALTGFKAVPPALIMFTFIVPVVVLISHRTNIRRLLAGNENRIDSRRHRSETDPM